MADYSSQDQQSLFGSLGQLLEYTKGIQEAQDSQGVNPQLLQGQQNLDLQRLKVVQDLASRQQDTATQNWMLNPNSEYLGIIKTLLDRGPQQIQGSPNDNPWAKWGAVAQQEAATKNWIRNIEDAAFRARGDTINVTPEQRAQNEGGFLNALSGILSGAKPQQAMDPSLLGALAPLVGNALTGAQKSRDQGIAAMGQIGAAQAGAQGQIGAAQATAQGNVGAAQAQYGQPGARLSPATKANLEQTIADGQTTIASLHQVAQSFNPNFFTGMFKAGNMTAKALDYVGLAPEESKAMVGQYQAFQDQTEQMFNAYRKMVTGSAATEGELKMIRNSIFNVGSKGPEAAKASLVNLMTEVQMKTYLAQNAIKNGLIKPDLKPGTEEFGKAIDTLYDSEKTGQLRQKVYDTLIQHYPKLAPAPAFKADGPTVKIKGQDVSVAEAEADLMRRGWVKNPQTGQWDPPRQAQKAVPQPNVNVPSIQAPVIPPVLIDPSRVNNNGRAF